MEFQVTYIRCRTDTRVRCVEEFSRKELFCGRYPKIAVLRKRAKAMGFSYGTDEVQPEEEFN